MTVPVDYTREEAIRVAFIWAARAGAGVTVGSRPIHWYQLHNCAALDVITEAAKRHAGSAWESLQVRFKSDGVNAEPRLQVLVPKSGRWRWVPAVDGRDLTPSAIYQEADRRARR